MEEERVSKAVKYVMEEKVPSMFSWIKIKLPVDINAGERWESWKKGE